MFPRRYWGAAGGTLATLALATVLARLANVPLWICLVVSGGVLMVAGVLFANRGEDDSKQLANGPAEPASSPIDPMTPALSRMLHQEDVSQELLRIERERHYEEMRPKLQGRFVRFESEGHGRVCRIEVRITSPRPLMNIVVVLPYGDKRIANGGCWLQVRHFGNALQQPGTWLTFEGLVHLTAEPPVGKVEATARCRDEYGTPYEYAMLEVEFAGLE
jgi:hypothetical protein